MTLKEIGILVYWELIIATRPDRRTGKMTMIGKTLRRFFPHFVREYRKIRKNHLAFIDSLEPIDRYLILPGLILFSQDNLSHSFVGSLQHELSVICQRYGLPYPEIGRAKHSLIEIVVTGI